MTAITEILGWFLIASGAAGLLPLLTGRDHGTHATPVMNWRRLRFNVIFPIALGCNSLALTAHGLTMWLLRVPSEVWALWALVSFALWFRSRYLRGLPMRRFWA
jgi:hypothetical protein